MSAVRLSPAGTPVIVPLPAEASKSICMGDMPEPEIMTLIVTTPGRAASILLTGLDEDGERPSSGHLTLKAIEPVLASGSPDCSCPQDMATIKMANMIAYVRSL